MNKGYEETFRVKCYEVDPMMNLKAFSFMNAAQEIAQKSAEQMGCVLGIKGVQLWQQNRRLQGA